MLEAVCFDLDGTLIDSTDAIVDSFRHAFATLGETVPERKRIVETISVPLEEQFRLLSAKDPAQAAEVYRAHYNVEAPEKTVLLPGARASLTRLKEAGLKLGIATSKRRSSAEILLEHLGVLTFFEACVGPEDVRRPKPDPESLRLVMQLLAVRPDSTVFIGDSPYDIQTAHGAGVPCFCVTTGYSEASELLSYKPAGVFDGLEAVADRILGTGDGAGAKGNLLTDPPPNP